METIEKQYMEEDLSLSGVSEQLHVSPNYLSANMKKYAGDTFMNLLIKKRMEVAHRPADDEQPENFARPSRQCGYSDQHYFSFCFKKYCGVFARAAAPGRERAGRRWSMTRKRRGLSMTSILVLALVGPITAVVLGAMAVFLQTYQRSLIRSVQDLCAPVRRPGRQDGRGLSGRCQQPHGAARAKARGSAAGPGRLLCRLPADPAGRCGRYDL